MRVAIECAGFTANEADQLRRSMATFKFTGGVSYFRDKLVGGMVAKGYKREFAEKTFRQLEGFVPAAWRLSWHATRVLRSARS